MFEGNEVGHQAESAVGEMVPACGLLWWVFWMFARDTMEPGHACTMVHV